LAKAYGRDFFKEQKIILILIQIYVNIKNRYFEAIWLVFI